MRVYEPIRPRIDVSYLPRLTLRVPYGNLALSIRGLIRSVMFRPWLALLGDIEGSLRGLLTLFDRAHIAESDM